MSTPGMVFRHLTGPHAGRRLTDKMQTGFHDQYSNTRATRILRFNKSEDIEIY